MTLAAINRLVSHAHIIQLTGESYRRRTAMKERK
jgi:DNA replication protein DnaC